MLRKKENIFKDTKKKTLFFPSHTTDKISQNLNPDDSNRMIEKIGNDFKPIDICLHWLDYKKINLPMKNWVIMFCVLEKYLIIIL